MFYSEIENSKVLKWALGALVFNYFIVFHFWIKLTVTSLSSIETFNFVCPPYFQNCDFFYFLEALPLGYSQSFFYMLLFGGLLWIIYLMSEGKWREAQLLLIPYFLWHALNVFVFTDELSGNYEFYVTGYGIILLFLPHKEFFLKLFIVSLYVLSTVVKIHPAWIEGGYFNHMRTGLPIFPDWSIPLWTNLIIIMEMVGAWYLLSRNWLLQRAAMVFFLTFHLYSGILVEYRYPSTVLPMFLIVFGPWYRHQVVPLDKKSLIAWTFFLALLVMQVAPRFIQGDEKLTLEANKYGLYMFESNHQCMSEAIITRTDGREKTESQTSVSARDRCNIYNFWFKFKKMCERDASVERISWTLDHSINGDPFLRIVDTVNVCDLEYKPFSHNTWIKTHEDNPEVIGWPVKNYFD